MINYIIETVNEGKYAYITVPSLTNPRIYFLRAKGDRVTLYIGRVAPNRVVAARTSKEVA